MTNASSSTPAIQDALRDIKPPAGATDWTVVIRPDKAPQWAYKGKPLYARLSNEKTAEEIIAAAAKDGHFHKIDP